MYEVMARRYRPATFDQVVGQEHIAATLKNAITRDRVAHAFIFTGGHGCGKTTMARILAKALVCEKGPTSDPCGVCAICRDVAAGRDSDVLEIDGASNNGIEQIRQLREQAAYVPTRARYKIYIIDEVHMLSDGAFNALLKTLEEPPRHVKFILATTDPHKVPDTILSRCQRFDFRLVPQDKLAVFFRQLAGSEQAAITDDALEAVAANAQGSVRDGLVLLDQLLSFADGEVTRNDVESVRGVAPSESVAGIFTAIANADVVAALRIVDEVAARGTNVGDFLDQLVSFGRDLMLLAATGSPEGTSAYGPARDTLVRLGKITVLETALLYLDVLTQARTRVRSRALTNPLVALEMAVARLSGLGGVTPISALLAKLDNLPEPTTPEIGGAAGQAIPIPQAAPIPAPSPPEPPSPPPPPEPAQSVPPAERAEEAVEERGQAEAEPPSPPPEPPTLGQTPPLSDFADMVPNPEPVDDYLLSEEEYGDETGVAVPAAAMVLPLTLAELEPLWDKILDRLAEKHPADFRHMTRIELDGLEGDAIVLAGPATAIEAWSDRRRLARLTETAEAVLRRPTRFQFVPRTARRAAVDTEAESEARYKLTRHPAVDKVKNLFDGVIVDCRTAAPPVDDEVPDDADDQGDET